MAGANPTDFSYQGLVNWAKNSLVNNVDARHIGGKEVALTTPQSGQALMYNGSKFVNADLAGAVYGKLNNTQINPAYLPSVPAIESSAIVNGYMKVGDVMFQWGQITGVPDANNFVTVAGRIYNFNVAFPSQCFIVLVTSKDGNLARDQDYGSHIVSKSQFQVLFRIGWSSQMFWFAIGK